MPELFFSAFESVPTLLKVPRAVSSPRLSDLRAKKSRIAQLHSSLAVLVWLRHSLTSSPASFRSSNGFAILTLQTQLTQANGNMFSI